MLSEAYIALRTKVDEFAESARSQRPRAYRCRAGCDACCRVHLSVCDVEADAMRAALQKLPTEEQTALRRSARSASTGLTRCVLLDDEGRCSVYEARPLVCRSQGLPLRYPPGVVPAEAVRAKAEGSDVTWCPLNFTSETPDPAEILDAAHVDQLLALINRQTSAEPLRRTSLTTLVEELAPDSD